MLNNQSRIVCLGDSITDGFIWPALWWAKFDAARGMAIRGMATHLEDVCGKAARYVGSATINADTDKDMFLNTGGYLQKVYLNGQQIFQQKGWTGYHPGKERLSIRLRQGVNTLLIETGGAFFLSITATMDWSN